MILVILASHKCALLTSAENSGAACYPATDRIASAATAADPGDPSAICQHGHGSSKSRHGSSRCFQPTAATDAKLVSKRERLPVSKPASTAANGCADGSSDTAFVTPPQSIGNAKHGNGSSTSSIVWGLGIRIPGL